MPDADDALRGEIEKVRDRARLQALAQGLPPDEADRRGQQAVDDFCSKWGIRPEMVGPARAARPAPPPARAVDLGSSPMRSSSNPSSTQAIRIADLMKRGALQASPPAPPPPPAPSAPAKPGLAGLLDRVRSQPFPDSPAAPAPAPAPPTQARAPAAPPAAASPATDDRRRQLLEQFDRTYAEVQTMLEQRIGVQDLALGSAPRGLATAFERAAAAGLGSEEAQVLAQDVQRLRDHLREMTSICDEFLTHIDEFMGRPPARGRP